MEFNDLQLILSNMGTEKIKEIIFYTNNRRWIGGYGDKFTLTPTLLTINRQDGTVYHISNSAIKNIIIPYEHVTRPKKVRK
jgi:hypothetical protein